ncbi:Hypothetical protein A7982_04987 [Minicystis rosea]|nr:Hypothetical protein A7982_04987 [Minicystis rosea]
MQHASMRHASVRGVSVRRAHVERGPAGAADTYQERPQHEIRSGPPKTQRSARGALRDHARHAKTIDRDTETSHSRSVCLDRRSPFRRALVMETTPW